MNRCRPDCYRLCKSLLSFQDKRNSFTLLKHLGYRQTEGISYTDVEWTFLPMCTIQTLYYLDMPLYHYVLGREGQTVSPTVMREKYGDNIKCTCSMILAYKKLLEQHDSLYTSEENKLMLNKKLLRRIKTMYKSESVTVK